MPVRRYVRTKFTDDEQEKLIKFVESKAVLYDRNHPDHRNNRVRDHLWRQIAKQLRKEVFEVKKRWRGIRDYRRMKKAHAGLSRAVDDHEQLQIIKIEENMDGADDTSTANNFEASESTISDQPEQTDDTFDELTASDEPPPKPSMEMLFTFYGNSVSALPPDLQRRCRLDVMEIINRYEEMAAYREHEETEVDVT